jgi:hypothetical protein
VAKGYDQRSGWTTMKLFPPWLSQLPFILFWQLQFIFTSPSDN